MAEPNVVGPSDPPTTRFIYRLVVVALFFVGVGGLTGILFLVYEGKTVPESVVGLASPAIRLFPTWRQRDRRYPVVPTLLLGRGTGNALPDGA